jgi:acyl-homoserine-lactone acylase
MFLTSSGGQSGNPASAHYDDAIPVWLKGETRSMPFKDENIKAQYTREYVLKPEL